jgi:hypothetical protein
MQGVDAKLGASAEKTSFCDSEVICAFSTCGLCTGLISLESGANELVSAFKQKPLSDTYMLKLCARRASVISLRTPATVLPSLYQPSFLSTSRLSLRKMPYKVIQISMMLLNL